MAKIVYNAEIMKIMSLFENITSSTIKDCIIDPEQAIFIVKEGMISKAIGKKGSNVRTLEKKLNRKIKIVEFNSEIKTFIKNFILPLRVDEIEEEDNIVSLVSSVTATKSMLIGRNARNLRRIEEIARRYFPSLKEIKVI